MIRRIELTNFMSHEQTVLEPAAGLTVLVGPNNCGKSAVVAALQILANNLDSNYVVRHGCKECAVVVETDDGHKVEWRRKKSPSYVIDGATFDRLGKSGLPAELAPALRIKKVEETGHDIHFGEQKSPLFLIQESAGNAAKFFAASSDVSRLVAMQNRHKAKLAEAKRRKGELEARSSQLSRELEALAPLVELNQRLTAQEDAHRELGQLAERVRGAEQLMAAVLSAESRLAHHQAEAEALKPLASPPVVTPTAPLLKLIGDLAREQSTNEMESRRIAALDPLAAPPNLGNTKQLDNLIAQLIAAATELETQQAQRAALSALAAPPPLAETAILVRCIEQLDSAARAQAQSAGMHDALTALPAPPTLAEVQPLQAIIQALAGATNENQRCQRQVKLLESLVTVPAMQDNAPLANVLTQLETQSRQLTQLDRDLAIAEAACETAAEELRRWAREQETCPTCGAPLDPDRVVAGLCGVEGVAHG